MGLVAVDQYTSQEADDRSQIIISTTNNKITGRAGTKHREIGSEIEKVSSCKHTYR
jgi:hypothetical protein